MSVTTKTMSDPADAGSDISLKKRLTLHTESLKDIYQDKIVWIKDSACIISFLSLSFKDIFCREFPWIS
jgi:hypothetical protein